jgi:hypothetical protein
VQYRINGILLPEGVSSLGPVLETGFIGNLNLLDGALPAQYGLRTAGVVDLTTRSEYAPGGSLSMYGGSFGTLSPSFDYGGTRFTSFVAAPGLGNLLRNTGHAAASTSPFRRSCE